MKTNCPINSELVIWFLFIGIKLDCLFLMKHHQHSLLGLEARFHSTPSLFGSGLGFVNERNSHRIWKEEWSGRHSSQEVPVGRCSGFWAMSTSSQFSAVVTRHGGSKISWALPSLWPLCFSPKSLRNMSSVLQLLPSWSVLLISSHICGIPNSYSKCLILIML